MELQEWQDYFDLVDSDVMLYAGPVNRDGYEQFTANMPSKKRTKLLLVLATFGGDPHAGYRIARAAIHHYGSDNLAILIPTFCKSAGTLICIAASRLVMCDRAELGPLDVQVQKSNEIFQLGSGLDIMRGMSYLQEEALQAFKGYLFEINGGSGLSTTIASEISGQLVTGLYEPLFAQIDPVKLGEMNAALQIANEYGSRLNNKSKSLKRGALSRLIHDYPDHGFVIDRAEARDLFKKVDKPTDMEEKLVNSLVNRGTASLSAQKATVLDFGQFVKSSLEEKKDDASQAGEGAPAGAGTGAQGQVGSEQPAQQPPRKPEEAQPSVGDEPQNAVPAPGPEAVAVEPLENAPAGAVPLDPPAQ